MNLEGINEKDRNLRHAKHWYKVNAKMEKEMGKSEYCIKLYKYLIKKYPHLFTKKEKDLTRSVGG